MEPSTKPSSDPTTADHEASPGSPLLSGSKDPEKQYGVSRRDWEGDANATKTCGCCFCTILSIFILFFLIFGLLAGFGVLSYTPYPSASTTQGILQGDTVPLYFADKGEIPNGLHTYWYKSISIQVPFAAEINTPVNFTFVEGSDACRPLDNRNKTENIDATNVNVTSNVVHAVRESEYLTSGSEIVFNVSIIDSSATSFNAYMIDNENDHKCFLDKGPNECEYVKNFQLKTDIGSNEKIEYTAPLSSYYYFVLFSTGSLQVDYEYTSSFSYYNITDYSTSDVYQACSVQPEMLNNVCDFKLATRRGCLFVYSRVPENGGDAQFVPLNVHVVHERFTIPSVACLTFAGAFFLLFVSCLFVYTWLACQNRLCSKYY